MDLKGAIFDLDGTVLDSMPIWDTAGVSFLRSHGIEPGPGLRESLATLSLQESAVYLRSEYGLSLSDHEIIDGINKTVEHFYFFEAMPKAGVEAMLKGFKRRGVRMCIATATDRHLVEAALRRTGIGGYFEKIFTCTEVNAGKESPEIYLRALEYLGTEKCATYIFEDALFAIKTAKSAGFNVAAVYDVSALRDQDKIRRLADVYIRTFGEGIPL